MRQWQYPTTLLLTLALSTGCGSLQSDPTSLDAPIPKLPKEQALKAADANLKVAVAYMQQNNMETANNRLQRALKLAPDYYATHILLGHFYQRTKHPERAEQHLQRALTLAPDNASAMDAYAQFLCSQKKYQQAREYFLKAATNPLYETPEIPYTNLASCLLEANEKAAALQYLLQALRINPKVPLALLRVASLKLENNDALTARAYLQRYESVAQHTSRSLWLAIQIERQLDNADGVASYELTLRKLYPDSPEAHHLNQQGQR